MSRNESLSGIIKYLKQITISDVRTLKPEKKKKCLVSPVKKCDFVLNLKIQELG